MMTIESEFSISISNVAESVDGIARSNVGEGVIPVPDG